jgi:hypothetical protein
MFKRSIKSPFRIIREAICRKLPAPQVIAYAITTSSFTRTWFITTVTRIKILFIFCIPYTTPKIDIILSPKFCHLGTNRKYRPYPIIQ